jgi:hypothetical protein
VQCSRSADTAAKEIYLPAAYAFGRALLAVINEATSGYRPALGLCVAFEVLAAVTVHSRRSRPEISA